MKKILFVCTGNTCRSCMAEGIFNFAAAADRELAERFSCSSAGLSAYGGDPASHSAMQVLLDEWGIDISSHKARSISNRDIHNADLVLTMTRDHKKAVIETYPEAEPRVYTLKEFTAGNMCNTDFKEYNFALDIMDPYGMSAHVYKQCAQEIKDAVDALIKKLEIE